MDRPAGATNDCVPQAISAATGIPYQKIYEVLCAITGRDASKPCRKGFMMRDWMRAMRRLGIQFFNERTVDAYGFKPTLRRFVELNGDHWKHPVLIRTKSHLFLVSRGKCSDWTGGRSRITDYFVLSGYNTPRLAGLDATTTTYKGRLYKRRKVTDEQIEQWCISDIDRWDVRQRVTSWSEDAWGNKRPKTWTPVVTNAWRRFQAASLAAGFTRWKRIYLATVKSYTGGDDD